jgi:hypothetical protein
LSAPSGTAVEVVETGQTAASAGFLLLWLQQVVDERLGMHLFLDVERRGVDDKVAPVLLILAAPHQLRVEVGVARVADVHPLGVGMVDRGDGLGG